MRHTAYRLRTGFTHMPMRVRSPSCRVEAPGGAIAQALVSV